MENRGGYNLDNLLEIRDLKIYISQEEVTIKALDGVDLDIKRGETIGIVGESGCGKTMTARGIMRIEPSLAKIVSGDILYYPEDNEDCVINIAKYKNSSRDLDKLRGKEISMIFQEPMSSLCPVYTVGNQVMEAILLHQNVGKKEARDIAIDMFSKVGIKSSNFMDKYPHHLSGGMRQRVMIATALSCKPKLLIADEPTSSLDVTIAAQILDLLERLQADFGMSIMFISHDLGIIAQIVKTVAVMYLGKIVEIADTDSIYYEPLHPYTKALLRSIPKLKGKQSSRLDTILGSVPDIFNFPKGCHFHPRCSKCMDKCRKINPELKEIKPGHFVRCLLYDKENSAI